MKYTREAFKSWLESLPDEPFCCAHMCPIGQFVRLGEASEAILIDESLAYAIDEVSVCLPGIMDWCALLPSDVLGIIREIDPVQPGQKP